MSRKGVSRIRLGLTVILTVFSGSPTPFSLADDLSPVLQHYMSLPAGVPSPAVRDLETQVIELVGHDCASTRLRDRLQCVLDSLQNVCTRNPKLSRADCQVWSDLFASVYTSGRYVLDKVDIWRLRKASYRELPSITRWVYSRHAADLVRIYQLASPVCVPGDPSCEASRLENFCRDYGLFASLPVSVCVALILKGSRVTPDT